MDVTPNKRQRQIARLSITWLNKVRLHDCIRLYGIWAETYFRHVWENVSTLQPGQGQKTDSKRNRSLKEEEKVYMEWADCEKAESRNLTEESIDFCIIVFLTCVSVYMCVCVHEAVGECVRGWESLWNQECRGNKCNGIKWGTRTYAAPISREMQAKHVAPSTEHKHAVEACNCLNRLFSCSISWQGQSFDHQLCLWTSQISTVTSPPPYVGSNSTSWGDVKLWRWRCLLWIN